MLARWHSHYKYINSLTRIGWTEPDIMLFDSIALGNHSYVATRAERIRNSEHWILKLNQDGAQQPLNRLCSSERRMQDIITRRIMARIQQEYRTNSRSQEVRQRKEQTFEGIEECDCAVDPRTCWRFFQPARTSSTNWEHNNWTTKSWNSWHSSRSDHS